jgi:hypothetical protein
VTLEQWRHHHTRYRILIIRCELSHESLDNGCEEQRSQGQTERKGLELVDLPLIAEAKEVPKFGM